MTTVELVVSLHRVFTTLCESTEVGYLRPVYVWEVAYAPGEIEQLHKELLLLWRNWITGERMTWDPRLIHALSAPALHKLYGRDACVFEALNHAATLLQLSLQESLRFVEAKWLRDFLGLLNEAFQVELSVFQERCSSSLPTS